MEFVIASTAELDQILEFAHKIQMAATQSKMFAFPPLIDVKIDQPQSELVIDRDKVAALGLRVKNGCSYHGLSLNVDMDLTPFTWINPCGYSGLQTIQLKDFGVTEGPDEVATRLLGHLQRHFPDVPPT